METQVVDPDRSIGRELTGTARTPSRPAEMDATEWLGGIGFVTFVVGALSPGFLPFLALVAVFTIPLIAVGVVAALLAAPLLGVWLIVSRVLERRANRGPAAPPTSHPINT